MPRFLLPLKVKNYKTNWGEPRCEIVDAKDRPLDTSDKEVLGWLVNTANGRGATHLFIGGEPSLEDEAA